MSTLHVLVFGFGFMYFYFAVLVTALTFNEIQDEYRNYTTDDADIMHTLVFFLWPLAVYFKDK